MRYRSGQSCYALVASARCLAPVPRHAALKPLYWGGAPLMKLAGVITPGLVTSNLALGQAMIALAGMSNPPATVECAQINRIAAGEGDPVA